MSSFFSFTGLRSNPNVSPPQVEKTDSKASLQSKGQTELGEKDRYRPADQQSGDAKPRDRVESNHSLRGTQRMPFSPVSKMASSTEGRIQELEATNRQNVEKLQSMETRYLQLQRLLDQRTSELRDAQAYLNKPDEYPGSTILKKVEGVNLEIFNTATTINDLFEGSKKLDLEELRFEEKVEFFQRCRQVAKQAMGESLYSVNCQIDDAFSIRDPINPEEPMPLQLALRCLLVNWAVKVVGVVGSFPGYKGDLKRLYEMIQCREEKSISSQWRVIAYGATKHLEESSAAGVIEEIMSVLCICGLSTMGPDYSKVEAKVHRRIKNMEKMLLSLKGAIHEGITSSDMEVVSVDTGTVYNPQTMVVDISSAGTKPTTLSAEQVLCTIGLGLKTTTMTRVVETNYFQREIELIKQPEVVLVTLLKDFRLPTDASFDQHLD